MTLGMVYCRIIQALHRAGFHRHQYSDYCHPHTAALHTYLTMVNLRLELAPSKLATIPEINQNTSYPRHCHNGSNTRITPWRPLFATPLWFDPS